MVSRQDMKRMLDGAEGYGDVRGQLERGAEPIDPDFYARWLKSKGSLDEAETCIRAHAAWREAFVTRGRIQEVLLGSPSIMEEVLHPAMLAVSCAVHRLTLMKTLCPFKPATLGLHCILLSTAFGDSDLR